MKETVKNCLEALERIELELAKSNNTNAKKDLDFLKIVISTGEEFGEKKAYIAKEVQKILADHNIEISYFYIKFIEAYNKLSVYDFSSSDTMIKNIIIGIDEIDKVRGNEPFTVAVFTRMSKEHRGLLSRIGREIIFLSDLKNTKIEDLTKIRGCGETKAKMLKEYLLSL